MVDSQLSEKIELVSVDNRRLRDENVRLMAANRALAQQLIERNELVIALEMEARVAKKRRKGAR